MKVKIYFITAILGILFSCAEEGPFKMGNLECNVDDSLTTPTTAVMIITIPQNHNNMIMEYDENIHYSFCLTKSGVQINSFYGLISGQIKKINKDTMLVLFYDLTPNTSYDCFINCDVAYNSHNNGWWTFYYIDSLHTSKFDDYSEFASKIKCEKVSLPDNTEEVAIKITLPYGWQINSHDNSKLYASDSSDMRDAIESKRFIKNQENTDYTVNYTYTFYFPKLESKTYYFELKGVLQNRYPGYAAYPSIPNVKIKLPQSIVL